MDNSVETDQDGWDIFHTPCVDSKTSDGNVGGFFATKKGGAHLIEHRLKIL